MPSIGASPAGYTSATTTASASLKQVQNSSNSDCSRVKRCGCTTGMILPSRASRPAFTTAQTCAGRGGGVGGGGAPRHREQEALDLMRDIGLAFAKCDREAGPAAGRIEIDQP